MCTIKFSTVTILSGYSSGLGMRCSLYSHWGPPVNCTLALFFTALNFNFIEQHLFPGPWLNASYCGGNTRAHEDLFWPVAFVWVSQLHPQEFCMGRCGPAAGVPAICLCHLPAVVIWACFESSSLVILLSSASCTILHHRALPLVSLHFLTPLTLLFYIYLILLLIFAASYRFQLHKYCFFKSQYQRSFLQCAKAHPFKMSLSKLSLSSTFQVMLPVLSEEGLHLGSP
jgi:hypothetical protein